MGGLEASLPKAIELWQRAIDLGETGAMCGMATLHLHDQSSGKDRDVAFALLRRAAQAGNEVAQYILGSTLVKEDDPALEAEGLRWIRLASSNHNASAHRTLGYFYRGGEHGLPVDASASRAHFEEADRLEESLEP
jgi:TPR repeat protein